MIIINKWNYQENRGTGTYNGSDISINNNYSGNNVLIGHYPNTEYKTISIEVINDALIEYDNEYSHDIGALGDCY